MFSKKFKRDCKKKQAFNSRADANRKTLFFLGSNRKGFVSYKCDGCRMWHLTKG